MTALGIILQSHGQALEESGESISMGNYLTVVPASPLAKPYLVCFSKMSTCVWDSEAAVLTQTWRWPALWSMLTDKDPQLCLSPTSSCLDCSCQTLFPSEVHGCVSNAFGDVGLTRKQAELRVVIKLSSEEVIGYWWTLLACLLFLRGFLFCFGTAYISWDMAHFPAFVSFLR